MLLLIDLLYVTDKSRAAVEQYKEMARGVYVRTRAVQVVLDKLNGDSKVAIITGNGGFGKTSLAMTILLHFTDNYPEYIPVIILNPKEWRKLVGTRQKYIIFIDDMLGASRLSGNQLEPWLALLPDIATCLASVQIRLVTCIRLHILAECRNILEPFTIFSQVNLVDLGALDVQLTETDRHTIITNPELEFLDYTTHTHTHARTHAHAHTRNTHTHSHTYNTHAHTHTCAHHTHAHAHANT
jgi:hypothetical protein